MDVGDDAGAAVAGEFDGGFDFGLERFLNSEELKKNKINYMEAFSSLVDLLIDGLSVRK